MSVRQSTMSGQCTTTVSDYEANKWTERPVPPTSSNITTVMTHGGTVTALMNERLGRVPSSG